MDLQSLEQLEERITELTERFLSLKEEHKKTLSELTDKNNTMEELNEKLKESQQTKIQIHSKVENILKKLEFLKNQTDQ
jgi:uncharacterized coiled-coil protein SlyX